MIAGMVPFKQTLNIPAVLHAQDYQVAYAPESSQITNIHVENGDKITKGDLLISLQSDKLDYDLNLAHQKLELLIKTRQRERLDFETFRQNPSLTDQEIEAADIEYKALVKKSNQLVIKADFNGTITDMGDDLRVGQTATPNQSLLRLIKPQGTIITAYIRESDLHRIRIGSKGRYHPNDSLFNTYNVVVTGIEDVNVDILAYPSLSSVHNGTIPTQTTQNGIKPLVSIYKITLQIDNINAHPPLAHIIPGQVIIGDAKTAVFPRFFNTLSQTFRTELSLN